MAGRPVHLTQAGAPTLRDRLWSVMRERRNEWLTLNEIMIAIGERVSKGTIRDYLLGYAKAGYVEATKPERFQRAQYRLLHDVGVDAPRIKKDGTEAPLPGRTRMWRAMRILKRFSIQELLAHTVGGEPIAEAEAETYCRTLARAGYLQGPGEDGRYVIVPARWSGPRAPMVQRTRVVWDPNLGKIVWPTHMEAD